MTTEQRPDVGQMSFDAALEELQRTVADLEAGGRPLEETLALYERGVALHERCARLLGEAEVRIQRLVERAGGGLALRDEPPGGGTDSSVPEAGG